jgi:hypothetical protein
MDCSKPPGPSRRSCACASISPGRRSFETSTVGRETLIDAQTRMQTLETASARLQLDIEEIQATSAVARTDVNAPLVGARDFVRERILLASTQAEQALRVAEEQMTRADRLVKTGLATSAVHSRAAAEILRRRAELEQIQAELQVRDLAVRSQISPQDALARLQRSQLELERNRAQRELELTRERIDQIRRLVALGRATELDLRRTEVEALEQEQELSRLREEIEALGRRR